MRGTPLILIFGIILLIGIIYADQGNNSNNNTNGNNNTNISCEEDDDCNQGYECEDDFCILEDHEDNETDDDENKTDQENEIKVCCMITKIKEEWRNSENQPINKTKYHWAEENDCVSENKKATKEIVNDTLCGNIKEAVKEKNRIKFEERTGQECADGCVCTGVVMKCMLEDGTREMTVYSKSGNIIFQVKSTNATTTVILYHYNNKTYGNFSDGLAEIKIFPDEIKEKIKEKKKIKIEQENISLDKEGIYKVEGEKKARFFFIFPVREKFYTEIDSENGEMLKFRNPWWGFLAKDMKED